MSKYVRCIDNEANSVYLTTGNSYKIIGSSEYGYDIQNDKGYILCYRHWRFDEPYDLPEPIVFLTQQDFEDAVMKTVMQRLSVFEWREGWKTHFGMEDSDEDG